ncbi:MAG: hypothetical protein WBF57_04045 [Mycobacterium sp.]
MGSTPAAAGRPPGSLREAVIVELSRRIRGGFYPESLERDLERAIASQTIQLAHNNTRRRGGPTSERGTCTSYAASSWSAFRLGGQGSRTRRVSGLFPWRRITRSCGTIHVPV